MKSLIVGAGMAGLTLAAKLCQQGRPPVVVERETSGTGGYALGLYPIGSCVLQGLGTYGQLADAATVLERYEMSSATGRVLQSFDMSVLTGSIGPLLMIERSEVLRLLESSCGSADLRRGVQVSSLTQRRDAVAARFADGTAEDFDVVVGCDGMNSAIRRDVFGPSGGYDSGWTLWTWWARPERFDPAVAREWWGTGCLFGAYPAPDRVMCAAGGPTEAVMAEDVPAALRRQLKDVADHVPSVAAELGEIGESSDLYAWPMRDVRARTWRQGRVALCGDAAVGFMPTAGVGASAALRAGAALADELSRADAVTVASALELYEKRCRRIIERVQTDSRRLARAMFVRSPALARARDELVRFYPASRALRAIVDTARQPF